MFKSTSQSNIDLKACNISWNYFPIQIHPLCSNKSFSHPYTNNSEPPSTCFNYNIITKLSQPSISTPYFRSSHIFFTRRSQSKHHIFSTTHHTNHNPNYHMPPNAIPLSNWKLETLQNTWSTSQHSSRAWTNQLQDNITKSPLEQSNARRI